MTADAPFEITLCAAPATAPAAGTTKVHGPISATQERVLSPVGVYVQHYLRRLENGDTDDQTDHVKAHADHTAAEAAKAIGNLDLSEEEDEEESEDLLMTDPKEWKQQDHYAVLGLSKLRYRATLDDVIKSHRKKVLRHHPDKKAAQGHLNDDGFFKCIQKAFEILTDPTKRRQWDSVDPAISDDIPSGKEKAKFYEVFGPVFAREARFSNVQPVPVLGDDSTAREEVEQFYNFWYSFDSWRSFEYLDKEDVSGGGNRDDKRYNDAKNRKERATRKKEDIQRVRTLVDNALKVDPRMARFKEEDKLKRNSKRNAREEEIKRAAEEKKAAEEAAKKAEANAAMAEEEQKKARQQAHKQLKKEQRALKIAFKSMNFFAPAGATPSDADIAATTEKLDKITAAKTDAEALVAVRTELEAAHAAGNGSATLDNIVSKL
ncbi:Zuotin [Coemansia spiralis]|uniref:Zuotin n=1 Tax=Coemansia spiralis TaxID=417178 RepID=A0A9W8GPJ5_9FUNG|nr:Zuotin [Coemansia spiralis]